MWEFIIIYDDNVAGKHSGAFYAATKAWRRANRPKVYYSFVMTAGRFRKLMPKQMYLVLRDRRAGCIPNWIGKHHKLADK